MREKILLVLSPGFAANEADTTCLPAQQQLVRAINRNFPDLKVVVLAFQYPFLKEPYQWFGNRVIPLGGRNRKRLHRFLVWIRAWNRLKKIHKQYDVKGITCFWYGECALVGESFARRKRIKCLTWVLGQDAREGNKYAKRIHPHSEELIAISDFTAKEFEKNYGVRPRHVIPNAVTPSLFPEYAGPRNIDIIGVGSLIALKQYDVFINIVAQLKMQYPLIRAMICGKGEEKEKLELSIQQNGLKDNIVLMGELPYVEVLKLMQRSKILLHPSSYEGFSGVCLEALYAGAHVISFCNPKNAWIRHWHIAGDITEMTAIAQDLLADQDTLYRPVLPYDMNDSAIGFMGLFG